VAEVGLDGVSVVAVLGELEPTGVPQHFGNEWELGSQMIQVGSHVLAGFVLAELGTDARQQHGKAERLGDVIGGARFKAEDALGQQAESIPLILEGIAGIQIMGHKWGLPFHLMLFAETYKRGAEFPGFCLLLTCDHERTLEIRFCFCCIRLRRLERDFPGHAMDLGFAPLFFCCFDCCRRFANAPPSVIELAEFRISSRQM
jgi:hypothetical protein